MIFCDIFAIISILPTMLDRPYSMVENTVLFSYPTSENISGVFCWIYLDWSHGMTRQHLSMFFGITIGLSLTIEVLLGGGGSYCLDVHITYFACSPSVFSFPDR